MSPRLAETRPQARTHGPRPLLQLSLAIVLSSEKTHRNRFQAPDLAADSNSSDFGSWGLDPLSTVDGLGSSGWNHT